MEDENSEIPEVAVNLNVNVYLHNDDTAAQIAELNGNVNGLVKLFAAMFSSEAADIEALGQQLYANSPKLAEAIAEVVEKSKQS